MKSITFIVGGASEIAQSYIENYDENFVILDVKKINYESTKILE